MNATRLICFRHPQYDGHESPMLTCKTCCGIFVTAMKAKMAQKSERKPSQLESSRLDPSHDSESSYRDEPTVYEFNPGAI